MYRSFLGLFYVAASWLNRKRTIDLSHILTNNGTESRLWWTKMQQMYENAHPSLALVLLDVRSEVECGKRLFFAIFWDMTDRDVICHLYNA